MPRSEAPNASEYRTHLDTRMAECGVPTHLREGLREYFVSRRATGGFLRAVLENDLVSTIQRADPVSRGGLPAIIAFLIGYVPGSGWGSREKVEDWLHREEPAPVLFE